MHSYGLIAVGAMPPAGAILTPSDLRKRVIDRIPAEKLEEHKEVVWKKYPLLDDDAKTPSQRARLELAALKRRISVRAEFCLFAFPYCKVEEEKLAIFSTEGFSDPAAADVADGEYKRLFQEAAARVRAAMVSPKPSGTPVTEKPSETPAATFWEQKYGPFTVAQYGIGAGVLAALGLAVTVMKKRP
jgi:hypothetical protein